MEQAKLPDFNSAMISMDEATTTFLKALSGADTLNPFSTIRLEIPYSLGESIALFWPSVLCTILVVAGFVGNDRISSTFIARLVTALSLFSLQVSAALLGVAEMLAAAAPPFFNLEASIGRGASQ